MFRLLFTLLLIVSALYALRLFVRLLVQVYRFIQSSSPSDRVSSRGSSSSVRKKYRGGEYVPYEELEGSDRVE